MVLLQEQNQCRATHKALIIATQCDPLLLLQQGLRWPSGLCFRLSTIYCRPLLGWPHVTCVHGGSVNCSQVKDRCATDGALHDRQTSDPPQCDRKPGRQTYVHECTHTHTHRESWSLRSHLARLADGTDFERSLPQMLTASRGNKPTPPRGALHKQPRHLLFILFPLFCF